MHHHLEKNNIQYPLVLCSERTRQSGYCDKNYEGSLENQPLMQAFMEIQRVAATAPL